MDNQQTKQGIISQLPMKFQNLFRLIDFSQLQEIRFRLGRQIMLYYENGASYVRTDGSVTRERAEGVCANTEDLENILGAFCNHSMYACQQEIKDGFLTLRGGHRAGICGRAVLSGERVDNITNISGINIRIAKQFPGCSQNLLPSIINGRQIVNALLISPPQCGKTTMLRDIARTLSEERKVTVVDERSEIAAVRDGRPQFDVGPQTDVLDRFPKAAGMLLAVRSLSPEVIITDEIGAKEDASAIAGVLNAGCKIITSIHGYDVESLRETKGEFLSLFDTAIVLTRKNGTPHVAETMRLRMTV